MRTIEFRVWDKDENKMFKVDELLNLWSQDDCDGEMGTFSNIIAINQRYRAKDREIKITPENDNFLLQYTGRKDSNGKKIYESDVLRYYTTEKWHSQFDELYLIEFKQQDLGHSSYQQTIGWNASKIFKGHVACDNRGILDIFHTSEEVRTEIIGNIHENPELLEAK